MAGAETFQTSLTTMFSATKLWVTSFDQIQEPAGLRGQGAPSVIETQGPAGQRVRVGAPSGERERKLYSEAVTNKVFMNKYKLTVKSNEHLPPETIKGLLKSKINPTEIKVGINTFKSLKKTGRF